MKILKLENIHLNEINILRITYESLFFKRTRDAYIDHGVWHWADSSEKVELPRFARLFHNYRIDGVYEVNGNSEEDMHPHGLLKETSSCKNGARTMPISEPPKNVGQGG